MDLLQILFIQISKDSSVENITPKSFTIDTVASKVRRINRMIKVNMGTNSVKRDVITFINNHSFYLSTIDNNY